MAYPSLAARAAFPGSRHDSFRLATNAVTMLDSHPENQGESRPLFPLPILTF
jgi:hypothetical protein